jgi:hypothetical protein
MRSWSLTSYGQTTGRNRRTGIQLRLSQETGALGTSSSSSAGQDTSALGKVKGRDVHKIINFYLYNDLFPCRDGRISIPVSSSCSGKVDESSLHISPYELNVNSISDIKTLKTLKEYKWHGPFSSLNRREPKGREKGPEKS